MVQWVAATAIFGQRGIVVVGGVFVVGQHNVFDDGAETNGIPDNRFVFLAQVDGFGVATTFEVKYGTFAPTVLVVADQVAIRICRQGGFTGAGEAEEQASVAVFANIGGAVHRHYVFFWQQEVLYREHGFFSFHRRNAYPPAALFAGQS